MLCSCSVWRSFKFAKAKAIFSALAYRVSLRPRLFNIEVSRYKVNDTDRSHGFVIRCNQRYASIKLDMRLVFNERICGEALVS